MEREGSRSAYEEASVGETRRGCGARCCDCVSWCAGCVCPPYSPQYLVVASIVLNVADAWAWARSNWTAWWHDEAFLWPSDVAALRANVPLLYAEDALRDENLEAAGELARWSEFLASRAWFGKGDNLRARARFVQAQVLFHQGMYHEAVDALSHSVGELRAHSRAALSDSAAELLEEAKSRAQGNAPRVVGDGEQGPGKGLARDDQDGQGPSPPARPRVESSDGDVRVHPSESDGGDRALALS